MLLRALKDAGDPQIARAQYACPWYGRQFLIPVHKLAHTLNGLFGSVPRDDVGLTSVVKRQLLQVLLNAVPALGQNGLAFVHERGKVKVEGLPAHPHLGIVVNV
jgi:hypothetical protein